jgi:hypothetical protein
MRRIALLLLLAACETHRVEHTDTETQAPPVAQAKPATGHVEFVRAPAGDVAAWVRGQRAELQAKGRSILLYEGAGWCEPCVAFHHAAEAGKLDAAFPTLTLLEFDADIDAERLALAGYGSRLIPLFAAIGEDGRGTGRQIEGGIKGDGAVDEIVARLRGLLDGHALN